MTSFISAGHHLKDSGAVSNNKQENLEMIKFRDLVLAAMTKNHPNVKVISDRDEETLSQYLKRIQTGNGSVVIEFHLDAASNVKASGTTAIVSNNASQLSKDFAKELSDTTSLILGIQNRGVKPESYTHVGRLGLMREEGIVCLLELCFITNADDMSKLGDECKSQILAESIANIIAKYDAKI